jgi:hypothetical protein
VFIRSSKFQNKKKIKKIDISFASSEPLPCKCTTIRSLNCNVSPGLEKFLLSNCVTSKRVREISHRTELLRFSGLYCTQKATSQIRSIVRLKNYVTIIYLFLINAVEQKSNEQKVYQNILDILIIYIISHDVFRKVYIYPLTFSSFLKTFLFLKSFHNFRRINIKCCYR